MSSPKIFSYRLHDGNTLLIGTNQGDAVVGDQGQGGVIHGRLVEVVHIRRSHYDEGLLMIK